MPSSSAEDTVTEPTTGTAAHPEAGSERMARLHDAIAAVNGILLGKGPQVKLAFACLLARGHLLIEDLPGVGKTTLAHALARVLGADYQRIQFTSDLMPADIVGVSIYRRDQERFDFHPGPIFADVVLADEVNRATPKTQSALLEAMAEGQVTVEGTTHPLPDPFFVIATQNPLDLVGTFPLPDSQLDRFLISISLGFPAPEVERELLLSESRASLLLRTQASLSPADVKALQEDCERLHISEPLLSYLQALLAETRNSRWFETGLSPRAGLALLRCARAHAFIEGRDFLAPEDIKAVFPGLARHRMTVSHGMETSVEDQVTGLLQTVPIP
jgi:MoxR-like ATPase